MPYKTSSSVPAGIAGGFCVSGRRWLLRGDTRGALDRIQEGADGGRAGRGPLGGVPGTPVVGVPVDRPRWAAFDDLGLKAPARQRSALEPGQ